MAIEEDAPVDELARQIAETVGRALIERDQGSRTLGIELKAIGPNHARLEMAVRGDMADALGTCHGGMVFALADTACRYAASAGNQTTQSLNGEISTLAATRPGDRLTAEALARNGSGRIRVCDVTVRNQDGELVALFRGLVRRLDGEVVPDITVTT